ncbi:MAG: hypothetical protein P1U77_02575, partial [Rubripirellula sp.]|nr:hypothetical protein [Rubripirellula sp.]
TAGASDDISAEVDSTASSIFPQPQGQQQAGLGGGQTTTSTCGQVGTQAGGQDCFRLHFMRLNNQPAETGLPPKTNVRAMTSVH